MIDYLLLICSICCVNIIIFCVFLLIKNENTFRNYRIISDAILLYKADQTIHDKECLVHYSDMVNYGTMLYSIFDWGYKHILPDEKFEIIEPYIAR